MTRYVKKTTCRCNGIFISPFSIYLEALYALAIGLYTMLNVSSLLTYYFVQSIRKAAQYTDCTQRDVDYIDPKNIIVGKFTSLYTEIAQSINQQVNQ